MSFKSSYAQHTHMNFFFLLLHMQCVSIDIHSTALDTYVCSVFRISLARPVNVHLARTVISVLDGRRLQHGFVYSYGQICLVRTMRCLTCSPSIAVPLLCMYCSDGVRVLHQIRAGCGDLFAISINTHDKVVKRIVANTQIGTMIHKHTKQLNDLFMIEINFWCSQFDAGFRAWPSDESMCVLQIIIISFRLVLLAYAQSKNIISTLIDK